MADKKISALTSATTPLAGTEVLPIVQSGATVKVTNNDLRPKQIQSNATSGVLQIVGPAAAATRVMTTPDANFTAARTDAAQSFTGNQTLTDGNLVVSSGKGIDFSATPGTGNSELFADYEEGTWSPSFTSWSVAPTETINNKYTKVGRLVTLNMIMRGGTIDSGDSIDNLPYAASGQGASAVITTISGTPEIAGGAMSDSGTTIINMTPITFGSRYWALSVTYST